MARPSLRFIDYTNMAKARGLTYDEPEGFVPANSRTTVRWQCNLTGHKFTKAYQRVKDASFGTRYQRDFPENMARYYALSKVLDIEFMYTPKTSYFPKNTKTKTLWRGRNGAEVEASFHELAYGAIPERLIEDLDLPKDVLGWDVSKMLRERVNA